MSWMESHSAELLRAWPSPWMAVDSGGMIVAMNPAMERFCERLAPWLTQSSGLVGAPLQAVHPDLELGSGVLELGMEAWTFASTSLSQGQVLHFQDRSRSTHLARFVDSAKGASHSLSTSLNRQAGAGLQTAGALQAVASDTRDSVILGRQIFEDWTEQVDGVLEQTNQVSAKVGERVSLALERSQAIAESSAQAIELLQLVSGRVAQMRSLAAGVDEIMLQTRMLSINARVEAARAGVHGSSFAVVANEVGMLAARTERIARRIEEVAQQVLTQAPECEGAMARVSSYAELGQSNAESLQKVMRKQDVLIASMREGLSLAEGPRAELVRHLGVIEASAVQCAEEAQRSQSEAERVGETAQDLEILSARFEDSDRNSPSDVYREVLDLNECLRAWVGVHMPPLAAALGPLAQIQVPGRTPADVFALAGELQQALSALVEEPPACASTLRGPIYPGPSARPIGALCAGPAGEPGNTGRRGTLFGPGSGSESRVRLRGAQAA